MSIAFRVLVVALALPACARADSTTAEPVLKRSIALPGVAGRIDHMAYDAKSKRLFIAALENGSLEVVDLEKGERVKSVAGLQEPQGVAFVALTGEVVVACGGDGTVRAYDATTLDGTRHVHVGGDADNVRVTADGTSIVVGHGDGALAILDARKLEVTGAVKLDEHPESFQLEPGTQRVFVNVPADDAAIVVADLSTRKVTATWTLRDAERNYPMALDTRNHRLYVGCRKAAKLIVIDTESGKVVASPDCVGDTDDVFVHAKTGRIVVIGGEGAIDVFETKDQISYTKAASVKTAPGARTALLVPERAMLYVAVPKRGDQACEIREYALGE